jgi:prepilin-type N-terminal cleavage/methylation domain-containing protein
MKMRKTRGFTLVELLVVIALMTLVLSLVGPLGQTQLDKSRATEEWIRFKNEVISNQKSAYLQGRPRVLELNGKIMTIKTAQVQPDRVVEFSQIFFEPQQISINAHGFSTPLQVQAVVRGQKRDFNFALADSPGIKQ